MAFDFTLQHRFKHGTETVTFDPQTGSSQTVAYAEKQAVQREESPGLWVNSTTECVWYLPGDEMDAEPKHGDAVQEAGGVRWAIGSVGYLPLVARYECFCTKER
jgi:hypothetical protein